MDTVKKTARSLYLIYKQLPLKVQKEFYKLIKNDEEWESSDWEKLSEESLNDIWCNPEEDQWDEFYQKQVSKK